MKRIFAQILTQKQFILLLFFIPSGLKTDWISVKDNKKIANKLQESKNRKELSSNEQRYHSIDSGHYLRSKDSVFEHHTKFLYRL